MRYLFWLFLFAAPLASADAYKCKGPNGKVVITAAPCDDGAVVGVAKSDNPDQQSSDQARADLHRQKAWLSDREESQRRDAATSRSQSAAAVLPPPPVPESSNSGSIFDKSWGCGGHSCPSATTKRR